MRAQTLEVLMLLQCYSLGLLTLLTSHSLFRKCVGIQVVGGNCRRQH